MADLEDALWLAVGFTLDDASMALAEAYVLAAARTKDTDEDVSTDGEGTAYHALVQALRGHLRATR